MFRYLSHEHSADRIALEQQRLEYRQATAVAQIQQQAEHARLRQLQLTNEQTSLAVSVQRNSQLLQIEQQRLANEQARLSLRISETQKQLRHEELEQQVRLQQQDIELKKLQYQQAEHELSYSAGYRYERSFSLKPFKHRDISPSTAEYTVEYVFKLVNKSEVPFEVSLFILDYYIGLPKEEGSSSQVSVRPVRAPGSDSQEGAIAWQRVGSTGSIYDGAIGKIAYSYRKDIQLVVGGSGTKMLKPDQTLLYSEDYFVRAPKNGYAGFVLNYCLNRCANREDHYSYVNWEALAKAPTVQKDDETPAVLGLAAPDG